MGVPDAACPDDVVLPPELCGNVCEDGKPATLGLRYTGLGPAGTDNTQSGSEVILDFNPLNLDPPPDPPGATKQNPAWIRVFNHKGELIFPDASSTGVVSIGEDFEVNGLKRRIPPRMTFEIYDVEGRTLLEVVQFHTSCSQPLFVGDGFGSIQVAFGIQ